jgi:hypothetical protein
VRSREGQGTIITIELPIANSTESKQEEKVTPTK